MVIAVATKALTGTTTADGMLPNTFKLQYTDCEAVKGTHGVYTCERPLLEGYSKLDYSIAPTARSTTVHFGYAWVPYGESVAAAVQSVQNAENAPVDATHGHALLNVVTPATAAARNTVAFDTPPVPAGRSARHRLRIHATDPGNVNTYYLTADGQPFWRHDDVRITNVTTSSGASCRFETHRIMQLVNNLECKVSAGDHTIEYTLTAPTGMDTWRLETHVVHDIYDLAPYGSELNREATFTAGTGALRPRHHLLTRDVAGTLYRQRGTGKATAPFTSRSSIGSGWQAYSQITKLEPVSEDLNYLPNATPAAMERGRGDLVARDGSGTLWYYQRQFDYQHPYKARTKVGTGWNTYNTVAGAGDLNGDTFSDLIARDKNGLLWLHKGTGKPTAPFAGRTKIGSGWQQYNQLTGSADLTGDGKPDLLARDNNGVLWLYKGTGKTTTPFTTRTKIGGGWQQYNALSVVGDVTDNGKPDLVARDTAGVLWLYKGTGANSTPFATRSKVSSRWKAYNSLV
ncbi:FG-GAP repeat domain-containing protein [Streptomyces sp. NPDC093225]|uniref:FG-GAP repeat domain-containing protein n=1 Tax=Streptomyces sp. NPDC093225 TaxID=3366034 RepID=UPI003822DCF8